LTSIAWSIQALNQLDWKKLGSMQMSIGSKALDRRMDLLKKGLKLTDF
jgi:hypothetical protein